jgi:hypothetical protein
MVPAQSRNLAPSVRLTAALPPALAWKLNRLRCMTPAEIGHRVVQKAAMRAERWGLVRTVVPTADLSRPVRSWIRNDAVVDATPYIEAARRIIAGRYDLFAMADVELGNPPRWNRDPKTGTLAPMEFGKELDYRDPAIVGDCKYLWEPNRHLHLVTLAQAYALTGEAIYADTLRNHLESWWEDCPFRMGANWASSLEVGMRLINWALAWQLLGGVNSRVFQGEGGEAFRARWLTSIYQHADFACGHFSLHSSANNHLIGEAAGVYIAAIAWPYWERARRWRDAAREILEREALLQNAGDGVNREQAVSYQQFTFDLLLYPMLAGEANGEPFPAEFKSRLESMLVFLASIMDVGGNLPMFGDADDAYVARLDPRPGFDRFKSSLATGAILFHRGEFAAKSGGLDDKARWLFGPPAEKRFSALHSLSLRLPMQRAFPEGGYYVLGCEFERPEEIRLVADVGPLGYREIAAHGHADALSFTLSVGGVELLVDPGTFAYHTETEWRRHFRGTSAHNTIRVDGQDQSEQGGNFMWLRKARAHCTAWMSAIDQDIVEGWHDGYTALADPVVHKRRITLDKRSRCVQVEDTLTMEGEHRIELFFHCAEGTTIAPIAGGVSLTRAGRTIRLRFPDLPGGTHQVLEGSTTPIGGWVSRRFDHKVPAPTLVWSATLKGNCLLRSTIDC